MSDNKETKQAQAAEAGARDERTACEAAWNKRYNSTVSFEGFGREYLTGWLARAALARASEAAQPAEPWASIYVECRECVECGHTGINDSHDTDAACGYPCGWAGPSPIEDKCPGCQRENVMGSACPKCSGRYSILAEARLHAAKLVSGGASEAAAVPEGWKLIPAKPTPEMQQAFKDAYKGGSIWTERIDYALEQFIAAAPQPASEQQPARGWTSVEDRLPESGKTVLATYQNRLGKLCRIRAQFIASKTREQHYEYDECEGEYDEATDTYYWRAGWYECIDNWGDYSHVAVCEGSVTHWMLIPEAPALIAAAKGDGHDD